MRSLKVKLELLHRGTLSRKTKIFLKKMKEVVFCGLSMHVLNNLFTVWVWDCFQLLRLNESLVKLKKMFYLLSWNKARAFYSINKITHRDLSIIKAKFGLTATLYLNSSVFLSVVLHEFIKWYYKTALLKRLVTILIKRKTGSYL